MISLPVIFLLVLGLGAVTWLAGRARAERMRAAMPQRMHSLPVQHGWYVALWTIVPAALFLAVWSQCMPGLVTQAVLRDPAARALPTDRFERGALLADARNVARGDQMAVFNAAAQPLVKPYVVETRSHGARALTLALLLAFSGAAFAMTRVRPAFRARTKVERQVMLALLLASLLAIVTTVGIVASLLWESLRFFSMVSPIDFLFGTRWSPQAASTGDMTALGAIPLFWGTLFIGAIIAMIVAIPLGLMSAVYLTQYAPASLRRWMKPMLEMLAGVPTVVYGYFAALTVAPALRNFAAGIGITGASSESALAAGLVMGMMIIPFVSSMADDSLTAVPQSMRDGSLALGATSSETIRKVLIPAALPGVVGGVLLAVSRAIGETMIVVMAAGLAANLTLNPFASVTTVTTQIVQLLTGDQEFDSAKTLAAFALGLVLFLVTLLLNIVALRVVKRYREAYE